MALEKVQQPYELLVRWRDGKLSGAHIQYIVRIKDDDTVYSESLTHAIPVDVGNGTGFPLNDILQQVQIDALAAANEAIADAEKSKKEAADASERASNAETKAMDLNNQVMDLLRKKSDLEEQNRTLNASLIEAQAKK